MSAPQSDTLTAEESGMFDTARAIGKIEGRLDAQDGRMNRIEAAAAMESKIVHRRFDDMNKKLDAMVALLNRWMGAVAFGSAIMGGLLVLLAAAIEGHWKVIP